jgi:hypothetical protein
MCVVETPGEMIAGTPVEIWLIAETRVLVFAEDLLQKL